MKSVFEISEKKLKKQADLLMNFGFIVTPLKHPKMSKLDDSIRRHASYLSDITNMAALLKTENTDQIE